MPITDGKYGIFVWGEDYLVMGLIFATNRYIVELIPFHIEPGRLHVRLDSFVTFYYLKLKRILLFLYCRICDKTTRTLINDNFNLKCNSIISQF